MLHASARKYANSHAFFISQNSLKIIHEYSQILHVTTQMAVHHGEQQLVAAAAGGQPEQAGYVHHGEQQFTAAAAAGGQPEQAEHVHQEPLLDQQYDFIPVVERLPQPEVED